MKHTATYILSLLIFIYQGNIYAEPGFSILFEDRSRNKYGAPFFTEIESYFSTHKGDLIKDYYFTNSTDWAYWKPKPIRDLIAYFQSYHSHSDFVFKFSLISEAGNDFRQLIVEAWDRAKYPENPFSETRRIVIADQDIYIAQIKQVMPFIIKHINDFLSISPPKEELFISKIPQLLGCKGFNKGFEFFFTSELSKDFYLLKMPCSNEEEANNRVQSKTNVIACFKKNEEVEFEFYIRRNSLTKLKFNCEADDHENKLIIFCKDIKDIKDITK